MRVPTSREISGIGPLARFYVESSDCRHVLNRQSTQQEERAADVNYWGVKYKLADLYWGSTEKLK